ncbi:hypothetical protein Tel_01620 [Candidatus Tenderia electrophaga]|jgi:uncharacterized protein YraI|uniref:SH3b domain-containing protein n=1 Tax=Candidatus Tenderia electrophaga TaxID=1748243 RepID=A0A0S2TA15_9GAMM|nr:hypothetical protein Tel_01620 [Candidatus Tenderia electrophaga]
MRSRLILALMALILVGNLAQAESGYIRAREAKVVSAPSAAAELVMALPKGTEVDILQRQGRWLEVQSGGRQGWVSGLLVGDEPPMNKINVLGGEDAGTLGQSARRRASVAISAAAARGLRSDERARQSDAGVADFGAVRQLESMGVSEDEAVEFMEQPH